MKLKYRSKTGAVMAAVDLMIMVPAILTGMFFLVDTTLGSYYKERLSFIAMQAATFAVNLPEDQDPTPATEKLVKDLLNKMNPGCSEVRVKVTKTTVADQDALNISLSALMPLLHGGVLPGTISLQETAVAPLPANRVCAAVAITPFPYSTEDEGQGMSPTIYVPVIQPRNRMPIWQFPYDSAINSLHVVQGNIPNVANRPNTYFDGHPSLY